MELRVERGERIVGNIYKGLVQNVLPGMDAAFVDIGLERNAFLYVADVLTEGEEGPDPAASMRRSELRKRKIAELLKAGQEVMVQVIKGPRGTKGARVSTRISLPGRYFVLMPDGSHVGISRKIEDREERDRLRDLVAKMKVDNFGVIVRTEAEGKSDAEITQDIQYLADIWTEVKKKSEKVRAPALVHEDASLLYRALRDMFSSDVSRLIIDDPDEYEKVHEVLKHISPKLLSRVSLFDGEESIFEHYNVEKEMERLLRRKVWLKSGGFLVIDEMEAITAIDVNTGKYTGKTSLAETILKTNLEAVDEACRQLRLRDMGGIIVLDFIDMNRHADRRQVMAALQKALKNDRAKYRIGKISSLGLVEMTRKRTSESVSQSLTITCPNCFGRGRLPSPETISLWVEQELATKARKEDHDAFLIEAHPQVAEHIIGDEGENVEMLEHAMRRAIFVRAKHDWPLEEFKVHGGSLAEMKKSLMPYRRAQVLECKVVPSALDEEDRVGWANGYLIQWEEDSPRENQTKIALGDVHRSFAFAAPVKAKTGATEVP
ncbi:MAG: Rne/Rng family ribonuclease [Armatimonadetes bacterium]|nr:Rne/Rng family ribonuclease [Armatimonadota bacterium]